MSSTSLHSMQSVDVYNRKGGCVHPSERFVSKTNRRISIILFTGTVH